MSGHRSSCNRRRRGAHGDYHTGWPGAYSAAGDYKTALKHAEIALGQAPDPLNRKNLEAAVVKLKEGQDMNAGS